MLKFGEGYRALLQQQRGEWEAALPGVTLHPLQLPAVAEGGAVGTNTITAAEKELEGEMLPSNGGVEGNSDVELVEHYRYSDVEFMGTLAGGDLEGDEVEL